MEKADNRGVAEGEDGYFNGTAGLPVGIHSAVETGSKDIGTYAPEAPS